MAEEQKPPTLFSATWGWMVSHPLSFLLLPFIVVVLLALAALKSLLPTPATVADQKSAADLRQQAADEKEVHDAASAAAAKATAEARTGITINHVPRAPSASQTPGKSAKDVADGFNSLGG